MKQLTTLLNSLEIGPMQSSDNLGLFPLLDTISAPVEHMLLDAAVRNGVVQITETSPSGIVSSVLLKNGGDRPVLLLDGEELVGCKQNRIVNLTVLVPARTSLTIPVSCVERGRWSPCGNAFSTTDRAQYATGRAKKARQVSDSLAKRGTHAADQSAIWDHLADKQASMKSASPTGAMADLFEQRADGLAPYGRGFHAIDGQVGALFAINGLLIGMELFASPVTFRHSLPKLIHSYALDALDFHMPQFAPPNRQDTRAFLALLSRASVQRYPAIGLGEDLRLTNGELTGAGLLHQDRLIHLFAFDTSIDPRRHM